MEILVLDHGLELAAIDAHLLDLRSGRLDALSNISLEVYKLPVLDTPKLIQEVLKVFDLPPDFILRHDESCTFLAHICNVLLNTPQLHLHFIVVPHSRINVHRHSFFEVGDSRFDDVDLVLEFGFTV